MDNCIFCKIIKGDIPSTKIYEDDHVLAFLDISQVTKGHTLVIPKRHIKDLYEMDEDTASHLFRVVPKITRAIMDAMGAKGLNVAINNREVAGQTVFHSHIHLIPRYSDQDGFTIRFTNNMDQYSQDDLITIGQQIQNHIEFQSSTL